MIKLSHMKKKTKIDNIYLVSESDGCKYFLNVLTGRVTNYTTHDKRHLHIFPSTAVKKGTKDNVTFDQNLR